MKEIIAKKVSMFELFYDLIFVYAISRITAMIRQPVAGGLPGTAYLEFIIVVIIVMQIWLYQALYINRFGKGRLIDIGGLLVSMYAAAYLANNINTNWAATFHTFNSAVLLIIANLLWQYTGGSGKHPLADPDVRAFIITLTLEFIAVLAGLLVGYRYGIYLCVLGGLIGFLMPLTIYHQFVPKQVNFPHLVERLSLIIIISFGESLVNVTQYFNHFLFRPLALVIFILLTSLFGIYLIQDELLINQHRHSRGFVLMYSHVFMVGALLSLTVGLDYLAVPTVNRLILWTLIMVSTIIYIICVLINGVYNHKHYRLTAHHYWWLSAILAGGTLLSFLLRDYNLGILCSLALTGIGECGYLLINVVHRPH